MSTGADGVRDARVGENADPDARRAGHASRGLVTGVYRALTSERTTSILVILLAGLVAVSAFVPQGSDALELARDVNATTLHRLAALGLTDVFGSAWLRALGVLLFANMVGVVLSATLGDRREERVRAPAKTPHSVELVAALPEQAVEGLRDTLRRLFGAPLGERAEGSRVTMVFDTSAGGRLASLLTHLGLIVLMMGAGVASRPLDKSVRTMGRAILAVKDVSSGKVGTFDMVAGEAIQFFRWPARYTLRGYVPSLESLGPAARLERVDERGQRESFWVFARAPSGFDERHRKGEVAIEARWMGFIAPPGQGLGSSTGALLLLVGLGLLAFGALAGRRVEGRLWVTADGERVVLRAVPRVRGDRRFGRHFELWSRFARGALEDE